MHICVNVHICLSMQSTPSEINITRRKGWKLGVWAWHSHEYLHGKQQQGPRLLRSELWLCGAALALHSTQPWPQLVPSQVDLVYLRLPDRAPRVLYPCPLCPSGAGSSPCDTVATVTLASRWEALGLESLQIGLLQGAACKWNFFQNRKLTLENCMRYMRCKELPVGPLGETWTNSSFFVCKNLIIKHIRKNGGVIGRSF